MIHDYDIIVFGGGIAGLYAAWRLRHYNLLVVENDVIGGVQTLASQGMIHGGQKYALQGAITAHAQSIAAMPARWEQDLKNLQGVTVLSETQLMFPAGGLISNLAAFAAAKAVQGKTEKLATAPAVINREPVYEMHEKVLDAKSLITALAQQVEGRAVKGTLESLSPDGTATVSGVRLRAKLVVFTAGLGNETALRLLGVGGAHTQRRPLRQVMVKTMDTPLFGHGVHADPKPRVTVTSHPIENGYVWYLGGSIAEKGVAMTEDEALAFAKKEMQDIFPHIDWKNKEWATWQGDRAEPLDAQGRLPDGPQLMRIGNVAICWPVKLTAAPALSDKILDAAAGITPTPQTTPPLPAAAIGAYPWETATWRTL